MWVENKQNQASAPRPPHKRHLPRQISPGLSGHLYFGRDAAFWLAGGKWVNGKIVNKKKAQNQLCWITSQEGWKQNKQSQAVASVVPYPITPLKWWIKLQRSRTATEVLSTGRSFVHLGRLKMYNFCILVKGLLQAKAAAQHHSPTLNSAASPSQCCGVLEQYFPLSCIWHFH